MPVQSERRSAFALLNLNSALETAEKILRIPIADIEPNPYQPRTSFPEEDLHGLAESIKANGLLQPIIVRRIQDEPPRYQIVAGERRFRAHRSLKQTEIPAVVRPVEDKHVRLLALLENLQREDLNLIDKSNAIVKLKEQLGQDATIEQLIDVLKISRRNVFRYIKIGHAHSPVQEFMRKHDMNLTTSVFFLSLLEKSEKLAAVELKLLKDEVFEPNLQPGQVDLSFLTILQNRFFADDMRQGRSHKNSSDQDCPEESSFKTNGKKTVRPIKNQRKGFWANNEEFGIYFSMNRKTKPDKKRIKQVIEQIGRFLKLLGIHRVP